MRLAQRLPGTGPGPGATMQTSIRFELNGRHTTLTAEADRPLLAALRGELGLTGAKYGCGIGSCGACTVLLAGKAIRACLTPLRSVEGQAVVTIEGLAEAGRLDALQQAFVEHGAL